MAVTDSVIDFTSELLHYLGIENVQVDGKEDEEYVHLQINVDENDSGILIGHHGDTIASLQRIINIGFFNELENKRIILNINDYKEKRESIVLAMTQRYVDRLQETHEPQVLPYLPANERLLIHMAYKDDPEIETHSDGEGRQRRIVLQFKQSVSE